MPITVQKLDELIDKDVFTSKGFYCGKVKDCEVDLSRFKLRSLIVEIARGTIFDRMLAGKRGVIVPYPMVQAIGDIVIIKHMTPEFAEEESS